MAGALVAAPLCPLMSQPTHQCQRADEALCGWGLDILDRPCPGWVQVRTRYGYTGFAPTGCLLEDPCRAAQWEALPEVMVTGGLCGLLYLPEVESWRVDTLPRGALAAPVGPPSETGWQRLALPNGREGYTKSSFLSSNYEKAPFWGEEPLRASIVRAAESYLGVQYRWGGKSPVGIDCSGLTFMSYFLHGITIFRDARIEPGFPVRAIPLEEARPADLLYFPGHVALYLGEGRYVHSTARPGSDGVVVNSLTPGAPDYRADLRESLITAGTVFPRNIQPCPPSGPV